MNVAVSFREWLEGLSGGPVIVNELDRLVAQINAGWQIEHTTTGAHGAVTATSLTTTGALAVTGASTLTGAATLASTLTVTGYGTPHAFSGSGAAFNELNVRNPQTAATSGGRVSVGNDLDATGLVLEALSSTFTAAGARVSGGALIQSGLSGGLSIAAADASGAIRFYSGGSTERMSLSSAGVFNVVGATTLSSTLGVTGLATLTGGYTTGAVNSYINDTSNANMTLGLTINQGAADDEILAFKSSDIAHGMTSLLETDTFGAVRKHNQAVTSGGVELVGATSGTKAIRLLGWITTDNTTKSTAAVGAIELMAQKKSGTSVSSLAANQNIVAVQDGGGDTRFILDSDGDSHQDVGTAWTNFDSHDDALVLDSLAYLVSREDDPYKPLIRQKFGADLESMIPRRELERIKLVTFNRDGHHFVNMSKLSMLLTGAVRQIAGRMRELEARIDRALPEAS